jgi:SAM-dependent methyltransferase
VNKHQKRIAPKPPSRAPQTHWGEVAEWYDQLVGDEGSEYHQKVILPGVLRLLDIKSDHTKAPMAILDLACGQGVLSRKLAALGHAVVGLDAAAPLVESARQRNQTEKLPIRYEVADATRLLCDNGKLALDLTPPGAIRFAGFDAITCILAIQNMTPLSPIWQACRTALKPGGSLILVMMHPCFRVPKKSDWIWEDKGSGGVGAQGRVIYEYLASSKVDIQTHPGQTAHGKVSPVTAHFHRPLQAYINTLGNAGLLIDHIEEWISHKSSQPGPKKAALDHARNQIPLFLALRARKQ